MKILRAEHFDLLNFNFLCDNRVDQDNMSSWVI